jgi:two-component system, OmpR family, response regulator ChvI
MKRILIVDDEQDNAFVFALILEEHGFIVDTFTDPTKALSDFKPNYYDLIILDYRMANLDGLELCKKIKSLDTSTKTMLLSAGHEQLQLQIDELRRNFLMILKKPISGSKLLEKVSNILNQKYEIPKDDPKEK